MLCLNCGKKISKNFKYCTHCGAKTTTGLDYDKIFSDIDSQTMSYLKNENMLTEYVRMKELNYKNNDIIWSIYDRIKLKYDTTNDLYALGNVLEKMGNLLIQENKLSYALQFYYCYFYCFGLARLKFSGNFDFGTTRTRKLAVILKRLKSEFKYEDFYSSVLNLIPSEYDETKCNKIFRIIYNQIRGEYSRMYNSVN